MTQSNVEQSAEEYAGPFLSVDHWDIAYDKEAAASRAGQILSPVVLGHGMFQDSSIWRKNGVLPTLSQHGHSTIAFDIPNSSENFVKSRSRGPAVEKPADLFAALLKANGFGRAVGVFPSQSGPDMAYGIMRDRPELLRGIVLIAPIRVPEFSEQLDIPALVIWGTDDKVIAPDHADIVAANFTNATVALIEGAGHAPQVEKPEIMRDLLTAFTERPEIGFGQMSSLSTPGVSIHEASR